MEANRATYAQYCALTCLGGSEKKQCPCERLHDCEVRGKPGFEEARHEARLRMRRYLLNNLKDVLV